MPRHRLSRRKYRDPKPETKELRRTIYMTTKIQGPLTASHIAGVVGVPLSAVLDEIDVLENFRVLTHQADPLGVIRWQPAPNNPWEGPTVPF